MSDKIYIWEAGNGNVGHGSMTLHDGTHISWWPAVDKTKSSMKKHMVGLFLWMFFSANCLQSTKYFLINRKLYAHRYFFVIDRRLTRL
jgi:ABC-type polysaccharide/polyol phosphate export permease